jgi:hypothetical protein
MSAKHDAKVVAVTKDGPYCVWAPTEQIVGARRKAESEGWEQGETYLAKESVRGPAADTLIQLSLRRKSRQGSF